VPGPIRRTPRQISVVGKSPAVAGMGSRFARTLSRRGRVKFSASAERAWASLETTLAIAREGSGSPEATPGAPGGGLSIGPDASWNRRDESQLAEN
jgi:hypothetical protein